MTSNFSKIWINLAQPRLGAAVVFATDDFFAPKERLINPEPPVFLPGKYDDHGKWMDGWESRRKRVPGHDYCIIRLGELGVVKGVNMDTRHFTGNYPPEASLEACVSKETIPGDGAGWTVIVPRTALRGDSEHLIPVDDATPFTHLRFHIYPDGGVARLRVYGQVHKDWSKVESSAVLDLLAMENGGRAIACNDAHYGEPANMIAPGRGVNMGDGWETRRRREPGNDWAILALGHTGVVREILVDTGHFKGNYPDRCSLEAALLTTDQINALPEYKPNWRTLMAEQKLSMDKEHFFRAEVNNIGPVNIARLNIFPDGGVSRLRLLGHIVTVEESN